MFTQQEAVENTSNMDTSDKFCLRWDSRGDTFAKVKDFSQFFDCTLTTDDDEAYSVNLRAHKVILSACSEFFGNILTKESMCANPNPLIYMRGISTQDMRNVLHFIYNGEVNLSRNEVDHFLEVAEILKIKGLMKGPIGTIVKAPEEKEMISVGTPASLIQTLSDSRQGEKDARIKEDSEGEIKEGSDDISGVMKGDEIGDSGIEDKTTPGGKMSVVSSSMPYQNEYFVENEEDVANNEDCGEKSEAEIKEDVPMEDDGISSSVQESSKFNNSFSVPVDIIDSVEVSDQNVNFNEDCLEEFGAKIKEGIEESTYVPIKGDLTINDKGQES